MTAHKKRFGLLMIPVIALFAAGFVPGGQRALKGKSPGRSISPRTVRLPGDRPAGRARAERYAPGQVLVKFKPSLGEPLLEATSRAYGLEKLDKIPVLEIYKYRVPESLTVEEMVQALRRNPDVEYAEPNYTARIAATPNDTLLQGTSTRFPTPARRSARPGARRGHPATTSRPRAPGRRPRASAEVTIAVIDTGVDLVHPDLKNKIKSAGKDFVNSDNDATDDNGHGTMVAGIAAADTNNNEGIAGVAWNCKILPVKVLDATGNGLVRTRSPRASSGRPTTGPTSSTSAWAPMTGAETLRDALKYAYEKGVVIVAAAGNERQPSSIRPPTTPMSWPWRPPTTTTPGPRGPTSGPEVDVAAPGDRILSHRPDLVLSAPDFLPYGFADGTSMAAPHVAGLAALIKGLKPWLNAARSWTSSAIPPTM